MRYVIFVISVVLGYFVALTVGSTFLVNLMAQCQGMMQIFTIGVAIFVLLVGLIFMVKEWFGFEDSFIGILITLGFGLVFTTVLPLILILTVGQLAPIKAVFCFDCTTPKKAAELNEAKDFAGARVILENFLKDESARLEKMPKETPDALKEQAQGCVGDAEIQLAQAYFGLSDGPIDELGVLPSPGTQSDIDACTTKVAEAAKLLSDAKALAEKHDQKALISAIEVQQKRLNDVAGKCKPTALITTERGKQAEGTLSFIARVLQHLDSGDEPIKGADSDLVVRSKGTTLDATINEHAADEQVCMLLLADSSGSIGAAGLEQIRGAVTQLNTYRKPADYYGVMPFKENAVALVNMTSLEPIDPKKLNIDGNETLIWDAVDTGIKSMSTCKDSIQRRTLVLLTDGKDTTSKYMATETSSTPKATALHAAATAANIDVCVIAVTAGAKEDEDSVKGLQTLATGCGFHYVDDFAGIAKEFESIFGITGHYYGVSVPGYDSDRKAELCYVPADVCVDIDVPESHD